MKDYSEIRKLIRESIQEELGREQRYVATMEFYVYAGSDEEADAIAKKEAYKMDMRLDNKASITKIVKQSFGTLRNSPVSLD